MLDKWPMRINKYLARAGLATRREADEAIKKGLVLINGRAAVLGDKINKDDKVEMKKGLRSKKGSFKYLAYNKPKGIVTSLAQGHDKEIKDIINIKDIFPVGRLDKDSHGLIILTNDGRVTDRLLNPKYPHEKEYVVKVRQKISPSFIRKMAKGINIERHETLPAKTEIINERTFRIIITEGKRHQIRRMCAVLRRDVLDLKRVRIMNVKLSGLKEGEYRELKGRELDELLSKIGLKKSS